MDFVALLSGGKDSCYNILKCQQYGHTLICLANLHPLNEEDEELNSWMYQSAGHTVIGQQAECIGVPLVRQAITGSAQCKTLDYGIHDPQLSNQNLSSVNTSSNNKDNTSSASTASIASTRSKEEQENEGDEVEDLFLLLQRVCSLFPSIKGTHRGHSFLCYYIVIMIIIKTETPF